MHLLPLVLLTTAATSAATTSPTTATTQECIPFKASHGYTCLCTTNHCDSVAPLNRTALSDGKRAVIYQTAKETGDDVGDRLRRFELPLTTTTTQPTPARTITFDPTTVSYQLYFHFIKLRHTLLPYATCTAIKNIFDRSTCQIFTYTHFFIWRPLSFFFIFFLLCLPFLLFCWTPPPTPPPPTTTTQTYQTIKGFGNAFTDAAAINYDRLDNKTLLLEQYWGTNGLGFSVGRVPIASCDFSTSSWSYDDVNNDVDLVRKF